MAGTLLPAPFAYFTDAQGAPLSGGFVYTYITGTDTPSPVYHDASLSTEWDNPIELPADGTVTMYQGSVTLKMKVYDADMNLIRTVDPIASAEAASSSGNITVFSFGGDDYYPITATSIPTGTTVAASHPGTSFFTIDSDDLPGSVTLQGMLQAGSGETVTASLVNLSQGSPNTPMVSIESTSTAGELQTSSVISFPAGGTDRTYAVKTFTATGVASYGWSFALVRSA